MAKTQALPVADLATPGGVLVLPDGARALPGGALPGGALPDGALPDGALLGIERPPHPEPGGSLHRPISRAQLRARWAMGPQPPYVLWALVNG